MWLKKRQRYMLGVEKMSLQGMEDGSWVNHLSCNQAGDLAGNAFCMPVMAVALVAYVAKL